MIVIADVIEVALEHAFRLVGLYGIEAGTVAIALVVLWHGHSLLAFVQSATRSARLAFLGAAAAGLLLVVGVAMGWLSVGDLPILYGVVR